MQLSHLLKERSYAVSQSFEETSRVAQLKNIATAIGQIKDQH